MANQVPDYSADIRKMYDTRLFDLRTEHGQGAFTDACVSMLHGRDEAWGHLIKKPGQTAVHDHGEDSALYLFDDGTAKAVDFIGGAGGPNPMPGWIVDNQTPYKEADWHDPTDHGIREQAPSPVPQFPYPDENTAGRAFTSRMSRAYSDAGRKFPDPNDADAFRHPMRFGYSSHEMPEQQAADKHIAELRTQLGVGPE